MSSIIRTRLFLLPRPKVDHRWESHYLFATAAVLRNVSAAAVSVVQPKLCRNHSNWLVKDRPSLICNVSKFGSVNFQSSQHLRLLFNQDRSQTCRRLFSVEKKPLAPGDGKSSNVAAAPNQAEDSLVDDYVPPEKLGIVAKFKLMYKQYWYVLMPVHLVTSTGWLIGFYYLSKR